ncbi:MAG: Uma2 family endonuclease, partial [Rhizobacter sp.]|nr:Uma2 family endonuclease [Chlorobiales bacterium]
LSPSTAYYDLRHKKEIYERFAVREYWILDPLRRSAEVYELRESKFMLTQDVRGGKGKITSQVLGGFELDITALY